MKRDHAKRPDLYACFRPGDEPRDVLILYAIAAENAHHFRDGHTLDPQGRTFPASSLAHIARLVHLDARTVRKRVRNMVEAGCIEQSEAGYVVPPEVLKARTRQGTNQRLPPYVRIPRALLAAGVTPWAAIVAGRLKMLEPKEHWRRASRRLEEDFGIGRRQIHRLETELSEAGWLIKITPRRGFRSVRMIRQPDPERCNEVATPKAPPNTADVQGGRRSECIQVATSGASRSPHQIQDPISPGGESSSLEAKATESLVEIGLQPLNKGQTPMDHVRQLCAESPGGRVPDPAQIVDLVLAIQAKERVRSPHAYLKQLLRSGNWPSILKESKRSFNGSNFNPPEWRRETAPPEADWKSEPGDFIAGVEQIRRQRDEQLRLDSRATNAYQRGRHDAACPDEYGARKTS